jgi:Flp pilus assembly protein TadG
MRKDLLNLCSNKSGNVAVMFAIVATLLVLAAGGAVDFSNYMVRKGEVQDAADAASVGAISTSSQDYKTAVAMTSDGSITPSTSAQNIFNSDKPIAPDTSPLTFGVTEQRVSNNINATVSVAGNFSTNFLGMVGIRTLPINVVSNATATMPAYVDFYMLLDNSPSMGLGATTADIQAMNKATGCAFACHTTSDPGDNYYATAQTTKTATGAAVQLRIDVVSQATQNLMTTATATAQANGVQSEFRVAIFDFGPYAYTAPALNNVTATTSNPSGLTSALTGSAMTTAISSVQLQMVPSQNAAYQTAVAQGSVGNNDEDTNFSYALTQILPLMVPPPATTAGNGSTASAPQKVLFFVTDGMVDMNSSGARVMGGLDTTKCTALKNAGVTIAILYTTYLPSSISSDSWSLTNAVPLLPQIAPALQACASPGLYYPVSPSDGISEAMTALFQKVIATVRVTS